MEDDFEGEQALTLMSNLPVPRMNPASVLPMPEANWPNAPALQVCESVPNITSPTQNPDSCLLAIGAYTEIRMAAEK